MKNKLKILILTLLVSIFIASGISVSASEYGDTAADTAQEATSVQEDSAQEDSPSYRNIFAELYGTALEHAAEIFSFLSLVGTLAVSYFYKKGLLPSVKGALSTLGGIVGSIKETSELHTKDQKSIAERADERLSGFESSLAEYAATLSEMEKRLIAEQEVYVQLHKSNKILSSQIDMLYDIFMTSSIPQYQKEACGERINEMRRELSGYESG